MEDLTDWLINREDSIEFSNDIYVNGKKVEKMSKADMMFEELGYEDLSKNTGNACLCLYGRRDKRIGFYADKTFDCYDTYDGSEYIEMNELQAINEKVKELGWI